MSVFFRRRRNRNLFLRVVPAVFWMQPREFTIIAKGTQHMVCLSRPLIGMSLPRVTFPSIEHGGGQGKNYIYKFENEEDFAQIENKIKKIKHFHGDVYPTPEIRNNNININEQSAWEMIFFARAKIWRNILIRQWRLRRRPEATVETYDNDKTVRVKPKGNLIWQSPH